MARWVQDELLPMEPNFKTTFSSGTDGVALAEHWSEYVPRGYEPISFPIGPVGRKTKVTGTGFAISASSENPETALLFIQTAAESNALWHALAQGGARPLVNQAAAVLAWREQVGAEQSLLLDEILEEGWVSGDRPLTVPYFDVIEKFLAGHVSLDDALAEMRLLVDR